MGKINKSIHAEDGSNYFLAPPLGELSAPKAMTERAKIKTPPLQFIPERGSVGLREFNCSIG